MTDLHLPDISEYQHQMSVTDWQRLFNEQHRRYGTSGAAIVRIDYGDAHVDRHLANRATALKAGARALGLYQYGVAGQPIHLQTAAFIHLVGKLHPGEFTIYDCEEGSGSQLTEADSWFADVDHALTYPGYHGGWLYSGEAFFSAHGLMPIAHSSRHTWVAAYGTHEPVDVPHAIWQHTNGQIGDTRCQPWPLIGRVDCSIFHGTVAQLTAKVWTPPTPPKPHVNPTPAPTPPVTEGEDVKVIRAKGTLPQYVSNGITRRWITSPAEKAELVAAGLIDDTVHDLDAAVVNAIALVGPTPR